MGLFSGIGRLVWWNKLGLQLSRLQSAFQKYQEANPMTWKQALVNALKHAGYSLGAVLAGQAVGWLLGPDLANIISKDFSPAVGLAAAPVIHCGAVMLQNALKVK